MLAPVNIGAARVDTILETEHLQPGQLFNAQIVITAGDVSQQIAGIDLVLLTHVKDSQGELVGNHIIEQWRINDVDTIEPGEIKIIPFEARLHSETPLSNINVNFEQSYVWLEPTVDFHFAVDASDNHSLHIHANEAVKTCMQAIYKLGFSLDKVNVQKGLLRAPTFQTHSGCYQELEYKPNSGNLFKIQAIALSFISEAHKTHVLIEMDRAHKGDGYVDLTIEHDHVNLSQLCDQLERLFIGNNQTT